jgi:hypothetical protein
MGFGACRKNWKKKVLKIDVDGQKRAVGKDLRARVLISLKDPLPRCVSIFFI